MNASTSAKMNTDSFTEYLQGQGMSPATIRTYSVVVTRFLSWLKSENMQAEHVRYQDILAFMKHLQNRGVGQRTIQLEMSSLKRYYDHLEEKNSVKGNPVQSIKVQGIKRRILYAILEPSELHTLYHAYPTETLYRKRYKVILGLLVYQGLNAEELNRLDVTDVKLKEGKIEIPSGRMGNARTLQLESHQVLDMYEYVMQIRPKILIKTRQETTKLLLNHSSRIGFLMTMLRKQYPKLKNAAHIRASVIVKWLKQYNIREVQYLAGHRYISSTESYQQNEMEGLSDHVNKFHPLQ